MKDKFLKYSDLLLDRCLCIKKGQPLLISSPIEAIDFIRVLSFQALKRGVSDIYYDWYDDVLKHDQLKFFGNDDIEKSFFWNKSVYDDYAKKGSAFLMFVSDDPDIMSDIDKEKIAYSSLVLRTSRPLYKKLQSTNDIAWCIASVSTYGWAKKVFGGSDCVDRLWNLIFDVCLVNSCDPIMAWNDKVLKSSKRCKVLNNLNLKTLHYTNALGTDLFVGLTENTLWYGAGEVMDDGSNIICNMPTEEIFTTPNRCMTNGIVYSSKPLVYSGYIIDDFFLEFKDGRVVNFDAKNGKDVLASIINGDLTSCFLGECALVDFDSSISSSNVIFYTTLFDENASCHLALGMGFPNCLMGTDGKSDEELMDMGINVSQVHVDFMIGTRDMKIEGITYDNRRVVIFENGNFVLKV